MAQEREAMSRRLGQVLGLDAPDMDAIAGVTAPPTTEHWVPVLFVSSSMPVTTLRTYAGQLERVGGVLAFRGMPDGLTKVAPMATLSAERLRHAPGCDGPARAMRAGREIGRASVRERVRRFMSISVVEVYNTKQNMK